MTGILKVRSTAVRPFVQFYLKAPYLQNKCVLVVIISGRIEDRVNPRKLKKVKLETNIKGLKAVTRYDKNTPSREAL